jgi:hypothetical protein
MDEVVHSSWVTHVQFSPVDDRIILYNHEWTAFDQSIRRMWIFGALFVDVTGTDIGLEREACQYPSVAVQVEAP